MTLFDDATVPRSPGRRGEAPDQPSNTASAATEKGTRPSGGSRNRRVTWEHWGEWLTHWQYGPAGRELVYMLRASNGKVRFYGWNPTTRTSRIVGRPEHDSVLAAFTWAYFHGWRPADRDESWAQQCRLEIMNNSTFKGPEDRCGCRGGDKPWHVGIPEVIAPRRIVPDPVHAARALARAFRGKAA